LAELDERRGADDPSLSELRALGVIVVLEGSEASFPLRLDSLERLSRHRVQPKRPMWLLLSVTPATAEQPERSTVWLSDEYRAQFLKLFEDYLDADTSKGQPRNRELVANVARIRAAVLDDLWQSDGSPVASGVRWWELWLRSGEDGVERLRGYAVARGLRVAERVLRLNDRTIVWVEGSWDALSALPFTSVPLAEIRRPAFVDTIEDLPRDEQDEFAEDLASRIRAADSAAPTVVHLDTGVRRSHALLSGSLAQADVHSVVAGSGAADPQNHGTLMAGLALFRSLDDVLLGASPVVLRHRLESVKILPDAGPGHDPLAYGVVTAEAVALPEVTAPGRRRVLCMPITAAPDQKPGQPTLWSASIDALAVGLDIARSAGELAIIGSPQPGAARLFVISAGNVDQGDFQTDYLAACDAAAIEDPAQAWNALTVGAFTQLTRAPTHPSFAGWKALGQADHISPHSRTAQLFESRGWPIKPDICMEGGNVLDDGAGGFHAGHPVVSLRTTDARHDLALGSANATSAATAQAARLAALARAAYPEFWPETIRGLLTHGAEWTPRMRSELDSFSGKTKRLVALRRYGWGVPTEDAVLNSARNSVTLVTQDEFVPFEGPEFAVRLLRLHQLPWPQAALRQVAAADVRLRVTLSYFVEPTASRRGWRRRYAYASHGLRFELKAPTETVDAFLHRVNQDARDEESGLGQSSNQAGRWLIGPNQRNVGSLHQDIWEGSAADLADSGVIAVHPVGGWWKNRKAGERLGLPVRYALIVSLRTSEQALDLYTPIAVELSIPIQTAVPGT
jgi:hypothetical protein